MTTQRFGVIDIGTIKVKLQIVEVQNGEIKTLHNSSTLTCLGLRMEENGGWPQEKHLTETITELKKCKKLLEEHKVDKVRAVSTHALREMGKIGQEIVKNIKEEVGLEVEIINQQEEAELFYRAALSDFKTDDDFAVVDLGSGSVQISIGNKNKLKESHLLKMGTVYLHDRFCNRHTGDDFPAPAEIKEITAYVRQQLTGIPRNLNIPIVYGSSCVIDVFKSLKLKLRKFKGSKAHPHKASLSDMEKFLENIIPIPYEKREAMFNFYQKYYMYGIDKAFLCVTELGRHLRSPYVIPSNANINQGLIQSLVTAPW